MYTNSHLDADKFVILCTSRCDYGSLNSINAHTHTYKIFKFLHQFDKKPQFVFCSRVHVTCLRVHTVAISFRWVYAYIHHQTKWTERKIRCNAKQRDNVVLAFRTTPISHHSVCVCVPAWFLSIELKWLIALVHLWSAFVFIQLVYRACKMDNWGELRSRVSWYVISMLLLVSSREIPLKVFILVILLFAKTADKK